MISIVQMKTFLTEVAVFLEYKFPIFGHDISLFEVFAVTWTFYLFMNFVVKAFGGRENV